MPSTLRQPYHGSSTEKYLDEVSITPSLGTMGALQCRGRGIRQTGGHAIFWINQHLR
jgi:hypothetical protein